MNSTTASNNPDTTCKNVNAPHKKLITKNAKKLPLKGSFFAC